jgi:hypothetical protein
MYNTDHAGVTRDEVLDTALKLLRFSLESHHEGSYHCTTGNTWGHTWISVLGMERMMHGVEAIEPFLTTADKALLRKVMISESDSLVSKEVVAGLYANEGRNKPESNLWNGAFLHRTADRYPDHPSAAIYREKGDELFLNSVSVPADASSNEVIAGLRVADQWRGANFFDSYALNHHGYLNVGYMVICLSNMAMLHFSYRRRGQLAPEALYHHVEELWQLIKACTFPDGRLLRIGGDTRVRYTYCQDYAIPMWLMIMDLYGEDECDSFEFGWLLQVKLEMDVNGDGSFLSKRCQYLKEESPLYFTRLDSDRAVTLSMGAAWSDLVRTPMKTLGLKSSLTEWHDPYHGAYLHRSAKRVASWTWRAGELPQGLILPANASDMAEWRENLSGYIGGVGRITSKQVTSHDGGTFQGGFLTWGSTDIHTKALLGEGQKDETIARHQLVCAALPDDTTMLVLQYASAVDRRVMITAVKGLYLHMPNDIFNGNVRRYYYEGGVHVFSGAGSSKEIRSFEGSQWLNVDERLGIIAAYGTDGLSVLRPGRRQIGLKSTLLNAGTEGMLYCDELCAPCRVGLQSADANEIILDAGFVLQADVNPEVTRRDASDRERVSSFQCESPYVRGIRVLGADEQVYLLLANFGDTVQEVRLPELEAFDLLSGTALSVDREAGVDLLLGAGQAKLYRISRLTVEDLQTH